MRHVLTSAAAVALILLCSCTHHAQVTSTTMPAKETTDQRNARMAWWRQARFGMFIHWGVYSVPAGTYNGKQISGIGEWIMNNGKIPVAEYAGYAKQFDPEKFNAEQWVQIAQDAGMKYMVITAKHHDGFCMFHTNVDNFNIYDATPFHRDPLAELADAAKAHDMKLGFYYSESQDWHHPGGTAIPKGTPTPGLTPGHWDPAQEGNFDDYLKNVAVPQVQELLTNYGNVAVLWFDTPRDMTDARAALFLPALGIQPQIVVNNRLATDKSIGDYETPEQYIPGNGFPGEDWETCMTINGTWGYKSYDKNFKSTEILLRNLIDIASKGGNYLLNVGPTAEGVIPDEEVQRLHEMGKWLKVNGDAIYDTAPTPWGAEAGAFDPTGKKDSRGRPIFNATWEWRCTTAPGKLYIHIFKWPADGTWSHDKMPGTVTKAYMLADDQHTPLKFSQDGDKLTVTLPAQATDPIASVLCLETASQ